LVLASALLAAAGLPAAAQKSVGDTPPATLSGSTAVSPGKAMGEGTLKTSATIVAIDPATRGVTLKRQDGKVLTLTLGDEVRNFDQLKVGDKVLAEYSQAVALELKKGGGAAANATSKDTLKRSEPGQKPGGKAERQVSILADV